MLVIMSTEIRSGFWTLSVFGVFRPFLRPNMVVSPTFLTYYRELQNPLPISLSLMVDYIWAKTGHFDASGDDFYSFEVTTVLKISMFCIYRDFPIYIGKIVTF